MPRLSSRLAQLAVTGACQCVNRLAYALPSASPVYLATGLGDVARTDALYYQVMPPCGEMASPALFATSGNNLAAFFVAQQFGLTSRNFTLSQNELSFEHALALALDDLAAGVSNTALLGGVDETTLPREFLVRRYPFSADKRIGEGSAWLVLGTGRAHAIGELISASISAPVEGNDPGAWADCVAEAIRTSNPATQTISLMPGTRVAATQLAALRARLPRFEIAPYLDAVGYWPAAAACAIASSFFQTRRTGDRFVHVNQDVHGRTGVMAWECHQPRLP